MNKKGPTKPPASDTLPPEDAELWERVAETAEPLAKGKNRVLDLPEPMADRAPDVSHHVKQRSRSDHLKRADKPQPPAPPPVAQFDRKETRRLGSGRTSVDARIDLHGMRQREAHGSLMAFLARSQSRGHKHVLVITGKGGKREHDGAFERGVLNREVPRWLSEPTFRQWVVSFAPASKRHGGEGALYVRLRRIKSA
jgi:DNA-nicking Smr family endonuclease